VMAMLSAVTRLMRVVAVKINAVSITTTIYMTVYFVGCLLLVLRRSSYFIYNIMSIRALDSCEGFSFHCPRSRQCVHSDKRCDDYRHCDQGEDEEGCGKYCIVDY
jgi:hypothetical protein